MNDQHSPNDDRQRHIEQAMGGALDAVSQPAGGWDTNRVWSRVEGRIGAHGAESPVIPGLPRNPGPISGVRRNDRGRGRSIRLASATALVAVALAFVVNNIQDLMPNAATTGPDTATSYSTKRAQRAEFTLPDGSRVILGPASTLRYTDNKITGRSVTLEGQAYFGVIPNDARPFLVSAAHSTVTVLGTTFSVRSYPSDSLAEVAVAEGKVALTGGEESAVLVAGDVGRVVANGTPTVVSNASIVDMFGWTRGRLSFTKTAFKDLAAELERAYDVDFRITDSTLANRQLSVTITEESLTDVLHTIAPPLGALCQRSGNTITCSAR